MASGLGTFRTHVAEVSPKQHDFDEFHGHCSCFQLAIGFSHIFYDARAEYSLQPSKFWRRVLGELGKVIEFASEDVRPTTTVGFDFQKCVDEVHVLAAIRENQ
jgi:hypothetical protein